MNSECSVTPPYSEAILSFRDFLKRQGLSTEIFWVFREDITSCRRKYWIRAPVPSENATLAQQYFELGRCRGLGVTLNAVCSLDDHSICFVWVPKDELDAEYAMQGPLKLSAAAEPISATAIESSLVWRWRCWLNRRKRCDWFTESLPKRKEIVSLVANRA